MNKHKSCSPAVQLALLVLNSTLNKHIVDEKRSEVTQAEKFSILPHSLAASRSYSNRQPNEQTITLSKLVDFCGLLETFEISLVVF